MPKFCHLSLMLEFVVPDDIVYPTELYKVTSSAQPISFLNTTWPSSFCSVTAHDNECTEINDFPASGFEVV